MDPKQGRLTDRDTEILEVLARKVRVISLEQLARVWWPGQGPKARARRRLTQLCHRGLIRQVDVLVRRCPDLSSPLALWSPGDAPPNFALLGSRLQSRWTGVANLMRVFAATKETRSWLGGGGGRLPRRGEASHDLGLAELFLRFRENDPDRALAWEHEDAALEDYVPGGKPDAVVVHEGQVTAIEFAGGYDRARLSRFHEACRDAGVPYEIW